MNKTAHKPRHGGFVSEMILVLVALIFLKYYFGLDIVSIISNWVSSPAVHAFLQKISASAKSL